MKELRLFNADYPTAHSRPDDIRSSGSFMGRLAICVIFSTADISAVFNSVMDSLCSSRHFKARSMLMIFAVFGQVGE